MKLSDRGSIVALAASTSALLGLSAWGVCTSEPGSGWQLLGAFTAGINFAVLGWCALLFHSDVQYRRRARLHQAEMLARLDEMERKYGPQIDRQSDVDGDGS